MGEVGFVRDFVDDTMRFSLLRDEAKSSLIEMLQSIRGGKCVLIDPQLSGLFNYIISDRAQLFKDNGVQAFRELRGDSTDLSSDTMRDCNPENVIYLVRPCIPLMKIMANHITGIARAGK